MACKCKGRCTHGSSKPKPPPKSKRHTPPKPIIKKRSK